MGAGDPWLKHPTWKRAVAHWRREMRTRTLHCESPTCLRPGLPIAPLGAPRGPWSLDVGHVVDRYVARAQGWTVEQANTLGNTRPEHARCGRTAGGRAGARITNASRDADRMTITSGTW